MFPGVSINFYYELFQDRLKPTSMATLALQHQHHQFVSSLKSGSPFDNWATSFYSTRSPPSQFLRSKSLHREQMYDCLSQGEMSPYYSGPSKITCFKRRYSATHCYPLQLLPYRYLTFDNPSWGTQLSQSCQFVSISFVASFIIMHQPSLLLHPRYLLLQWPTNT